ncbi:MAG: hypothetical protein FWG64_14065 [Firmicutes bacterium]|nr:hypothetical protein [Bacillota bacterium]
MTRNQAPQVSIQESLQYVDDAFQFVVIALEKLEACLEIERTGNCNLKTTAVGKNLDFHDDIAVPPTEQKLHAELENQCIGLFMQSKSLEKVGKQDFDKAVKYFLNDLLSWYGGRKDSVPPNVVECYFLPIAFSVSQSVKNINDISDVIKQYVVDTNNDFEKLPDDVKKKAVLDGHRNWVLAVEKAGALQKEYIESGKANKPFAYSAHKRGTAKDGLNRILSYFVQTYKDPNPVIRQVAHVIKQYLPEQIDVVTHYTNR